VKEFFILDEEALRVASDAGNTGDCMTIATMDHIPLNSAYLCQDCNAVGNNSRQCPACASSSLLGLASVFDREEERKEQSAFLPSLWLPHTRSTDLAQHTVPRRRARACRAL
jgi:hypothetical protein